MPRARATAFFALLADARPAGRLQQPTTLPQITDTPAREFATGWWAGIAVGGVSGVALAVLMGWLR